MELIEDYALIGNGRASALISKNGSIDWLSLPRFDSSSIFASILDAQAGCWKIHPLEPSKISRHYLEDTNVLVTEFITKSGSATLTDFFTSFSEEEKKKSLQPDHELIRRLECKEGEIELEFLFAPRPGYGGKIKWANHNSFGLSFAYDHHQYNLFSTVKLSIEEECARAKISLKKGERVIFSLICNSESPAVLSHPSLAEHKMQQTIEWWQNWVRDLKYSGTYLREVKRSALVLKLLCFAPSGAFIAAPTTSLPEKLGGSLNWDYRFCWLRDSAFTVKALFQLGFEEEAMSYVSWLLHSTRLTLPKLNVLYDVYGRQPKKEKILPLRGYKGSLPVRINNGAQNQTQLDCYGEVIEAVVHFIYSGNKIDKETKNVLTKLVNYVCDHWREEDHGIWEYRENTYHYTYSKMMCWVAIDRFLSIQEKVGVKKKFLSKLEQERDAIRREIENKGWCEELKSYVGHFGGTTLDITLLLMAFYGFHRPDHPRLLSTFEQIKVKLMKDDSLVYRTMRGKEEKEGAFLMCSFWLVEYLAKGGGTLGEAKQIFEKLLKMGNDVGLYSEEIDPTSLNFLGNFPQAFTHFALINAALAIAKREKGK